MGAGDIESMILVAGKGVRHKGAAAIPEITRRLPGWRLCTPLLRALLSFGVLGAAYRWVARNRGRFGGCLRAGV